MKVRNRNFRKGKEEANFWPAFTDVMSTIVLVFFFLILLAYFQQIISVNVWNERLNAAKEELSHKEEALLKAGKELDLRNLEIDDKEAELRELYSQAERLQAEVEQGQIELRASMKQLDKQQSIIADTNTELGNMRSRLQEISVLRLDILESVKESIESEMGDALPAGEELVTIGDNANLIINESLLFPFGSAVISGDGEELLKNFANAFEKVLNDKDIRGNIDYINIIGHADNVGDASENYELSCERAYKVLISMMELNPMLEYKYGTYFAATGFSEFRPIYDSTDENFRKFNRRIEISINIKDSNVDKIIDEYMNGVD